MGKRRSSLRQVPWQSWKHWEWVATGLFSDSPKRISAALDTITAWQSRGHVPIAVESTAAIMNVHQRDPHFNHDLQQELALPEELLRMMYAMAIQRLVNGVVDPSHKRNTTSVAGRADLAGLPRLLVDIRHEAAHIELPGLSLLQVASKQALAWLKVQYWDQQRETLVNARMVLKSKLVEHCRIVFEILNPSLVSTDLHQSKDGEEAINILEERPQDTLTVKKQERSKLFDELLDLSLSSTSDLVSILVDDAVLEQGTSSSLGELDCKQPVSADSPDDPDLVSAIDNAWKFTIRKLSSSLPHLPEMLLVAMIKRINKSCSYQGEGAQGCWTDQEGSTLPFTSATTSGQEVTETDPVDFIKSRRLISWCSWLLGKGASQELNNSKEQELPKSKVMKMSDYLSIEADLSDGLLRELLRMCFSTSSTREPLVELVSLISARLGGERFQRRATALAQLGTHMKRVQAIAMDRPGNQETGLVTLVQGRMEERSPEEMPTCEDSSSGHCAKSNPGCSGQLQDSGAAETESALDIARRQQAGFLTRLSSKKNAQSTISGHPRRVAARSGVPGVGSWKVAENWRPCAIGMIPSPCHSIGVIPSLDLEVQGNILEDQRVVQQKPGYVSIKENPVKYTGVEHTDNHSNDAADLVEPGENERKKDEQVDAAMNGKRLKRTGYHVQFTDRSSLDLAEKVVGPPGASPEGHLSSYQSRCPQKNLTQGCLLQHGLLMHVTPQQLESLKSAIRVL